MLIVDRLLVFVKPDLLLLGGQMYLLNGPIWVASGVLYREGRSGIVMRFHREVPEDDEYDFEEEEEEYEDEEYEEGDEDDQDSLNILHNMVFGSPKEEDADDDAPFLLT